MNTLTKAAKRLKIWEIALLLGLAVVFASGATATRTQDQLADKVVRLHVLANSDSAEDQALKLRVRDTVLAQATQWLEEAQDSRTAESLLRGRLLEVERLAAEEIQKSGYDYSVTAEVAVTEFPTREYDSFTLPAGDYLALRIIIGEGSGQNWWCVVFPPLCTAAASDVPVTALAAGLSAEEVSLITEEDSGYVLKFKTVEFWEMLRQRLQEKK